MPVLRNDPKYTLKTRAFVKQINYESRQKKVTGVTYIDMKTGEEYEQPAGMVILSAFTFGNTHMMLYSGIGQPYYLENGQRRCR